MARKNKSTDTLAPHEIIEDLDKAWEAIHPYESCGVDTLILTHARFYPHRGSYESRLSKEESEAFSLLKDRYRELIEQDTALGVPANNRRTGYPYEGMASDEHANMINRIQEEWITRYFLPRVEPLEPEDYKLFLHTKIANTDLVNIMGPLDRDEFVTSATANMGGLKCYRVLADLEMVPLYGSKQVRLLVPPNVNVTGKVGHSEVVRWSQIEAHDDTVYTTLRQKIGHVAYEAGYKDRLHTARLKLNQ